MHYFTSVNVNYLPKARVLAKSVKEHNPGALFHLMYVDESKEGVNWDVEPFDSVVLPSDLGIPDVESWIFKHNVVELCTAVKGSAFIHIMESFSADKVVYLDPDMAVFSHLGGLSALLDKYSIILTPHQVEPEITKDAIVDNEICSMKHGVYNLGFLAVRHDKSGLEFLRWWRARLLDYCYDDISNGLFTDQKWVDLAPGMFDGAYILRDKTYNVATWNLTHRHVVSEGGRLCIGGEPLKIYHFSGFDSGAQEAMLRKYASINSPLFGLREWYLKRLDEEGQEEMASRRCVYQVYTTGEVITKAQRLVYRLRSDISAKYPNPRFVDDEGDGYCKWYKEYWEKEHPEAQQCSKEQVATAIYEDTIDSLQREIRRIRRTPSFRIGRLITFPGRLLFKIFEKTRKRTNAS